MIIKNGASFEENPEDDPKSGIYLDGSLER